MDSKGAAFRRLHEEPGAFSVAELADAGVKRISVGGSLARTALGAFVRAAHEIKTQGTFGFSADAIGYAELVDLLDGRTKS